jgi:AAA+ superfamily predicted ATPase
VGGAEQHGDDELMTEHRPESNAANLTAALEVLERLIRARLKGEPFGRDGAIELAYFDDGSPFGGFIRDRQPPFDAYVAIVLALAPHLRPGLLEAEFRAALAREGDFPEIGGIRDEPSRAMLPTGETLAFLLTGDDLAGRFHVQRLLEADAWLATEGIVGLEPAREGAPHLSGRLVMGRDWIARFTTGTLAAPAFGAEFPARRIATDLTWEDLVLTPTSRDEIERIEAWLRHGESFRKGWGMEGRIKPGFRALFHGPPGTGKTLTATLIGRSTGREVYRIDLSSVVSKYIGETEKNLAALFDRAERRDWVLFFDEADALFGKRTQVKDAHDRYANQEVSYLLQRVEDFDGLVILASNFRANMDDAFLRRFNAIVRFPLPGEDECRQIWERSLPQRPGHEGLAAKLAVFELSGGNIVNVVQHAGVAAEARGASAITLADAVRGVAAEMEKEGRLFKNLLEADTGPL